MRFLDLDDDWKRVDAIQGFGDSPHRSPTPSRGTPVPRDLGGRDGTGGQYATPDHTFKLTLVNSGGYDFTTGTSVIWLNNIVPDLNVAGTHVCTFTQDVRNATKWIGQYNGTVV